MRSSPATFVAFIGFASAVVFAIHYYLYSRLVRAPELGPAYQRAGAIAIVALALFTPLGMIVTRALPRPASTAVAYAVYGWFGLAALLFFGLVGSELVRLAARAWAAMQDAPIDPSRRVALSRGIAGAVGLLSLGLAGVGTVSAVGAVAVRKTRVALAKLPSKLAGFRVVQISDLHVGPTIGRAFLEDVVERVNACEPDLVAITGDLVDGSVENLRDQVAPLAKLRAKHGVFFVTGNHEYYSGVDEWIEELGRLGVRVLRNERVAIGDGDAGFDLAGVDDWSARRFGRGHGADLARALDGRDESRALVLLAHQPKQIDEAAKLRVDLQLSGHTHGGQIFPWQLLVMLDQPFIAGLGARGDTQIYVSRGTGYWGPPMRVGAPSEITLLELHPERA